ncbi:MULTISPECIES: PotD/PotF family extracellular solute-binding protein [unclassified Leucobacter]|uniref:ABC transporter substrate-binding protein n=1 Tax=unclassified Leucobacter TaxID=2621730 RepID=UPI00165EAEE2|nr:MULTISPECIES: spermidine/putrescine ABC transporter substrate-binding protein [unclassified Leucobacter]MBC9926034.1 spermidine/putrescine ABC transporter substrate-binding protein [Leucobacter sp. cx-169]
MTRPLPTDPLISQLVRRARGMRLSRRQLFTGTALGAAALGTTALAGCAPAAGPGDGSGGEINWANWTYYLDFDEETGSWTTLDNFMKQTNITVNYYEDIEDNNTFIGKIKDQLKLHQDTGYDTFCLSDTSVVRLLERKELQEFDRAAMPNTNANMIDIVQRANFDPDRISSVPYQAGMTGLVYNTQLYPAGVRNVSDLWAPALKGKVGVLSEMDDTLGLIMLEQGVDVEGDWGDDEFEAALDVVKAQLQSQQIATVKGNSYTQDLEQGVIHAGMAWSGDVAILNEDAGEEIWKFVVPDAGATLFVDSFCMPVATEKRDLVQELIEYYYEPEVAAEVAAYVQYVTPVKGAQDAMAQLAPELAENPLIFPDEEMSARIFDVRSLSSDEDNRYTQAYQKVLGN